MSERKPLKRHKALQPFSREHHHGLMLCWKIRKGFLGDIDPQRIKRHTDWFYTNYLLPHFAAEEEHIFPILGKDNELIKKCLSEHRRLSRLFEDEDDIVKSLSLIEEELEKHIRFEERIVFQEIQKIASDSQLKLIDTMHSETQFEEDNSDPFWI
ncbi:hemerythrin domain-containing protein [Roseivirga sp. UBA1976]|uniref:hemerythrin domain-containing protein n=1 Tax=Roseivirga sp. UBA1976 TaxID=1947386 RepID=UPI00257AFF04|nr:hemerythrin domain-containing protein [Roseivirga sp. UBA1976]|tara:strand:- start:192 stop:656 length:465 start_codon:yes stop_codon:yes gene_type:complete